MSIDKDRPPSDPLTEGELADCQRVGQVFGNFAAAAIAAKTVGDLRTAVDVMSVAVDRLDADDISVIL